MFEHSQGKYFSSQISSLYFPCCSLCLLPCVLLLCNSQEPIFLFRMPDHYVLEDICLVCSLGDKSSSPCHPCFRQHSLTSAHPGCPAARTCKAQGSGRVLLSGFEPSLCAQQELLGLNQAVAFCLFSVTASRSRGFDLGWLPARYPPSCSVISPPQQDGGEDGKGHEIRTGRSWNDYWHRPSRLRNN